MTLFICKIVYFPSNFNMGGTSCTRRVRFLRLPAICMINEFNEFDFFCNPIIANLLGNANEIAGFLKNEPK